MEYPSRSWKKSIVILHCLKFHFWNSQAMRFRYLVPCLIVLFSPSNAQRPPAEIGGRSVALSLIQIQDRKIIPLPSSSVTLMTELRTLEPPVSVSELLASNGIEPDVGAYSLIYDLNPSITRLDKLNAGFRILLPKVNIDAPDVLREIKSRRQLVVITVDPELWLRLDDAIADLTKIAEHFNELPEFSFRSPEDKRVLGNRVADLRKWFQVIHVAAAQRKGPPTRRDTLMELRDEAIAVNVLLHRLQSNSKRYSDLDKKQIENIHQDIRAEIRRYDEALSGAMPPPDVSPCCPVKVVVSGSDARFVAQLRVYYILNGLFRDVPPASSIPFSQLGSDQSETLRPKNYRIWVAPDGMPIRQLSTQALYVEIDTTRDRNGKTVQLLLKRDAKKVASAAP